MQDLKFFDTAEAIKNIGGDEEIYLEILKTFAETYGKDFFKSETPEVLNLDLAQILESSDLCHKIGKSFHKLKGSAFTVGANKLGEASKDLEKFLRNDEDKSTPVCEEKLKTMLDHFEKMYEATIKELQSLF